MRSAVITTKLRKFLYVVAACSLHYSGALRLLRFVRSRILCRKEICVLGLHRVLTDEERIQSSSLDGIVVRQATFAGLLEYLSRQFSVVSMDTFLMDGASPADSPKPRCLLTFDDGWSDNHRTVYPLLKKFGMPATIFLTTGLIDQGEVFWIERLRREWTHPAMCKQIVSLVNNNLQDRSKHTGFEEMVEHLKNMPSFNRHRILECLFTQQEITDRQAEFDQMMTWDQVLEMSSNGIEFGAHTIHHPLLTLEDEATVEQELRYPKDVLQQKLGRKVRAFAYPSGDWDERVREQVRRTGYECAFTTRPGWHVSGRDPFTIRRILLHEGNVTGWTGKFSPATFNFTLAWSH